MIFKFIILQLKLAPLSCINNQRKFVASGGTRTPDIKLLLWCSTDVATVACLTACLSHK